MSQAGPVDLVANTPSIPTMFVTDSGIAVPVANTLDIVTSVAAAGTHPIQTTGASNVVTIHAQTSQAIAATDATKIGLAAFNSADFTVDANGFVTFTGAGASETLTGNSGGPVGPTANNINTVGTGSITIAGNPGTSTLTTQLTGLTNHAVLIGAGTATITNVGPSATTGQVLQSQGAGSDPAFSTATYPATTTINQLLYSSSANTVAGLATANRGVLTTGATGVPVVTALATDGQLIIGSTAGAPAAATLSAGSGITITNASNSITIAVTAGTTVVETLTGNSGGAISPTAGNINTLGTGSITIAGAGSTLTTQLTGLTNHSLLVGAGTATITNLGVATNGQLPIGSTAADPVLATITAGTGVTVTNGAGSITIAATGGGITWSETSGTFTAAVGHGYFITAAATPTMPAAPSEGDVVAFAVDTASTCTVTGNTGQVLRIGAAASAAAGTAANNARGDSVKFVYKSTGTTWFATSFNGIWSVT